VLAPSFSFLKAFSFPIQLVGGNNYLYPFLQPTSSRGPAQITRALVESFLDFVIRSPNL
jgi:hypothetical protein